MINNAKSSVFKSIIKVIVMSIFVLILYGINSNKVQATVVAPAIEVSKYKYDETNNDLIVAMYLNPGMSLTSFNVTLEFDGSKIQIVPYTNGAAQTYGEDDINVVDSSPFGLSVSYSSTDISIDSEVKNSEEAITNKTKICEIRFKLKGNSILEEDLPNNLFDIARIEVSDDTDTYTTDNMINILPMAKVVSGIKVTNPVFDKEYYKNGDTVNLVSGTATISYTNVSTAAGATRVVELENTTLPIDKGPWIADVLNPYGNVTYKGKSDKINIPIIKYDLNDDAMTIKYGYKITDNDLQNYNIIITKTGEVPQYIPVTADMLVYNAKGAIAVQTAYINYNGEKLPFYITLENYVDHIKLSHENVTVDYDSKLDSATLGNEYKVIPVMANGEIGTIGYIRDYINKNNVNTKKEGIYTTKVTYLGKSINFTVVVVDPIVSIKLEDEEKEKIQLEYRYNEDLQLNGAQLTIVKLSGESKIDLTKDMIKNYNPQEVAIQKLNIEYDGQKIEDAIEVEVKDYIVDIILIKPSRTSYLPGEKLDLTGATVQTLSASGKLGNAEAVTLEMISGYKEDEMGTQRITVTYEGFEKTFDIIIGVQTGPAYINVYGILITIMAISSTGIIVILTTDKNRARKM